MAPLDPVGAINAIFMKRNYLEVSAHLFRQNAEAGRDDTMPPSILLGGGLILALYVLAGVRRSCMSNQHSTHSTLREHIIEHVFVGDALRTLWRRGIMDVEVLRSEFDAH